MGPTAVGMVAGMIDWIEKPTPGGPGRTPVPTETVLETCGTSYVKASSGENCGQRKSGLRDRPCVAA